MDERIRIFVGAYGDPRVPDMKHAADILLGIRFGLDLYINFRPVKLYDERLCPLAGKGTADVDFVVFRENTEGAYVGVGGQFKRGTVDEVAIQEEIYTRRGVERSSRAGRHRPTHPTRTGTPQSLAGARGPRRPSDRDLRARLRQARLPRARDPPGSGHSDGPRDRCPIASISPTTSRKARP